MLKGINICVVGPKTAEALESYGLRPDLVPSEFKAEGVVAALGGQQVKGPEIPDPAGESSRELIPDRLREQGAG